jgi:regulator of replication initiation timing
MLTDVNPYQLQDIESIQRTLVVLLNMIEELKQENDQLRKINQELRDENNRLKGEQGKPTIKPNKKINKKHSSEKERRTPQKWHKSSKNNEIKISRTETLEVDRTQLPRDAQLKGYEQVIVQDLKIEPDNICFLKEKWYSPSERRTWLASCPVGYEGQFGPALRAMVITFYYGANMSEPKISELLSYWGISISEGQISNLLTKQGERWDEEKGAIYEAGLASSHWQHVDDTSTRVNGVNQYCHILGNPLYTAYFTRPHKDRLTLIAVLQNLPQAMFLLNRQTSTWLTSFELPQWVGRAIALWPHHQWLTYEQISAYVNEHLSALNEQQRARVLEAAALTAYHAQTTMPVLAVLMSDDARQFRYLTSEQGLCWVHDGRHYTKLTPCVAYHQQVLADFRQRYWAYYAQLEQYRAQPDEGTAQRLRDEFDELFSTQTGYDALDKRIAQTRAKKEQLLLPLKYPEMPFHNNPAELGARQRVRKRDVSFGPRTAEGVRAWDTFMTLAETAKKLGVSFYAYVYDRIAGRYLLPHLAELIRKQSPATHPVRVAVMP